MDKKGIAANIQQIIREKGLVQRITAERAGFTEQQFCDLINGRKIIRAEYIPAIAEVLGVEIATLFEGMFRTDCAGEINPVFPAMQEKQESLTVRYGNTEVIQTKDSVRIQVQCKNHLDFATDDDLSTRLLYQPLARSEEQGR